MDLILAFDAGLCLLLAYVAWNATTGRDDFGAVVFFIVYGLVLSLAWVRLGAPDVALAEAAIGAGLTGVLLLGMLVRLPHAPDGTTAPSPRAPAPRAPGWPANLAAGVLSALVGAGLATAVLAPEIGGRGLGTAVAEALPATGLGNPVTSVLLVQRGYDTLLETVVLLVALTGLWSLTPEPFRGGVPGRPQRVNPGGVLAQFGRLLPPLGILVAAYLWWVGAEAPGGAFQAATVLAAAAMLVVLAGLYGPPAVDSLRLRLALVLGPGAFVAVGLVGMAAGAGFPGYPAGAAKPLILGLEAALTLSIAATLTMLVAGIPERSR
ncbi:MAG TPA: hydrogenase subunit MbhD domain-containing protein [Arenibaculum sp.]|nr:hydrogenase subunit MbhD domain-containing protein [Arenibaculum sp.]